MQETSSTYLGEGEKKKEGHQPLLDASAMVETGRELEKLRISSIFYPFTDV
jgi:hypothetical protein